MVEPPELADVIDTNQIIQKYLPKQTYIDKILKIILRKVLERYSPPSYSQGDTGRTLE